MKSFITRSMTWSGFILLAPFLLGFIVIAGKFDSTKLMVVLLAGIVLFLAGRIILTTYRLKQRDKRMQEVVSEHPEYTAVTAKGETDPWFRQKLGAIDELHGVRDPKVINVISTPDWTYGDFTYNLYGRTKNGEYVRSRVYYGVMTTQLPRELPHVFFDSIKARRRQFRFHFDKDQRHSLEGDFDQHFATYFPDGYTVDSMSFIAPDVMWAIRAAKDYDIEIYGNRLFLYGPLYDPEKQLQDMSAKIAAIKAELIDNILTYRDERLPFIEGRKKVAIQGASLKISRFWKIVGGLSFVAYIILRIILEMLENS